MPPNNIINSSLDFIVGDSTSNTTKEPTQGEDSTWVDVLNASGTFEDGNLTTAGKTVAVVIPTLQLLLAIFTLFGNTLVLMTIIRRKDMQTPSNVCIFQLAISDIIAAIGLLLKVIDNFAPHTFDAAILCPVMRIGLLVLAVFLSIYSVTGIAIDRLIAVTLPYSYPNLVTVKRTIYVVIMIWVYVLSFSLLPPTLGHHYWEPGRPCYLPGIFFGSLIFYLIGNLYFCLAIITIAYIIMFRIAAKQANQIAANQAGGSLTPQVLSRRMHLKTAKTLGVLIGVFAVCWLPYACNLIDVLLNEPHNPLSPEKRLSEFLAIPVFLNSTVNPIIYGRTLPGFKQEFIKILKCCRTTISPNITQVAPLAIVSHNDV